jgi:glycosyltransferase involved in cell wall biosynthesis
MQIDDSPKASTVGPRDPVRPRYSIILPTYNRADLLPLAIQSVLDQTYSDLELIISNGGSTDSTREVVQQFHDGRIRYVETPDRLGMIENYELALSHASGEFIVFFSDDDALVPSALERIDGVVSGKGARMVVFPFAHYFPEKNNEMGAGANSLQFAPWTGEVTEIHSRTDIERMAARFGLTEHRPDSGKPIPLIGNVVFERAVMSELKSRTPSLFDTVPVDIYFVSLLLSVIESYYVIDLPLLVWSQWERNSSASKLKNLREHYEALLGGRKLDEVPLKFALPMNCSANALLQADRQLGGALKVPVSWDWYFVRMYEYLSYLRAEGVKTDAEVKEFQTVMSERSESNRQFFLREVRRSSFMRRQKMKRYLRFATDFVRRNWYLFRSLIPNTRVARKATVDGTRNGFDTVLGAAKYIDERL